MTQQTLSSGADVAAAALDNPEVMGARLSLLSAALDGVQDLGTLTDEEIAGLNALELESPLPAPWFSTLTDDEKQIAMAAALRGLCARGQYLVEPAPAGADEFRAQVAPQLLAILTMRVYAERVYVAERVLEGNSDFAVLFDQTEGLWLAEYIDHRGLHQFRLGTAAATADALNTWSGGSVAGVRPQLDATYTATEVAARPAALEPVASSTVGVTITGIDPKRPDTSTWSGLFSSKGKGAYVVTREADDRLRYRGAGSDEVRSHWMALLGR